MTVALLNRGSRFGEIRPTRFRGSGGFSDVYEAFDSRGRRLALKVLRSSFHDAEKARERFERERLILASIDNRSVARLISADFSTEPPWIASEFVDGPSLREAVGESGPFSTDDACVLLARLAATVRDLHEQGIAHRDISPNNIILGPDGPVLIDFGAARLAEGFDDPGTQMSIGTPAYASPEQLKGLPVGLSADIFALARVFQFAVQGRDPTVDDAIGSDLDQDFRPLLQSALSDDPSLRPSAEDLARSGLNLTGSNHRLVSTSYRQPDLRKLPRRYGLGIVLSTALVTAAIAVIGAIYLVGNTDEVITAERLLATAKSDSSQEWTTEELRGTYPLEVAVPRGWEVSRQRPVENGRGGNSYVTAIDSFSAEGQDGKIEFTTEIINRHQREEALLIADKEAESLPVEGEIASMFDQHVDQFEVDEVPNGCVITRAATAWTRERTSPVVAMVALTDDCRPQKEDLSERYFGAVAHLYFPVEGALLVVVAEDYGQSLDFREVLSKANLTSSPLSEWSTSKPSIDKPKKEVVLGETASYQIDPDAAMYFHGRIVLDARDKTKSVRISSIAKQDTNFTFYGINRDDVWQDDGQKYFPLGTKWFDDSSDEAVVLGGTTKFDTVIIEFESLADAEPAFEIDWVQRAPMHHLLSLNAYEGDGIVDSEEDVAVDPDDWWFGLPLGGEADSGFTQHALGNGEVTVPKDWFVQDLVANRSGDGFHMNPLIDYLPILEDDSPQLNLYREQTAATLRRDDGLWYVKDLPSWPCVTSRQTTYSLDGWSIIWRVHHSCPISDSYASPGSGFFQMQMNPSIQLYVVDNQNEEVLFRGSYTPAGLDSVDYWKELTREILEAVAK